MVWLSLPYMTIGKTIALTIPTFINKVTSLLFNTLSRFVIAFLPRSLLILRLHSLSVVILEAKKIKSVTVSIVSPSICHEVIGPDTVILVFWMLSFKPVFHPLLSPSSGGSLVPLHFPPLGWCHLHIRRRQWQPTPVLLPGESRGWRSLVGYSPWGHRVRHDWVTSLSLFTFMHWRRKWQHTPVFLPGESQGRRCLVGCHLWGRTESDTTDMT